MSNVIEEILTIRKPAIITIIISAVLLLIFLIMMRKFSFGGKYNKLLGLFVGLNSRSALHLTFAWIKYIYFCAMLFSMEYATLGHYLILGFLVTVSAFMAKETRLIIMEVVGGGLELIFAWVCSVFIDYINNVRSDLYVFSAYWIIAVFMVLCTTVVFIYEVMSVSRERSLFETNWNKK